MSWYRRKSFALVAATVATAAFLGASLGIAVARVKPPLESGFNLVGGPSNDIAPDAYVGCLPNGSWAALYIFDSPTQTWKHYFPDVPGYVNQSGNGGIGLVPRGAGVALIMNQDVATPRLRDSASEGC